MDVVQKSNNIESFRIRLWIIFGPAKDTVTEKRRIFRVTELAVCAIDLMLEWLNGDEIRH
jgi:hypothetical protein